MIYKTINIKKCHNLRSNSVEEIWRCWVDKGDASERIDENTTPNGCGFYHYPETMSDKEAFETLKSHLIKLREKDLKRLTEGLFGLKALVFQEQK